MKKNQSTIILAAIILIAIVAGIIVSVRHSNPSSSVNLAKTTKGYKVVDACNLLTKNVAQSLIGVTAAPSGSNGAAGASSDIYVSICTYSNGGGTSPTGINIVTVLVRSAKDSAGGNSNNAVFGSEKPKDAIAVSGYGSEAFWDQQHGQFVTQVDHNNIYITAYGNNTGYAQNTLSDAKIAASLIVPKN